MNNSSGNKLQKAIRLNHIDYWLNSANHNLDVAETLFQNEKYDWCRFIAHLVLENWGIRLTLVTTIYRIWI